MKLTRSTMCLALGWNVSLLVYIYTVLYPLFQSTSLIINAMCSHSKSAYLCLFCTSLLLLGFAKSKPVFCCFKSQVKSVPWGVGSQFSQSIDISYFLDKLQ